MVKSYVSSIVLLIGLIGAVCAADESDACPPETEQSIDIIEKVSERINQLADPEEICRSSAAWNQLVAMSKLPASDVKPDDQTVYKYFTLLNGMKDDFCREYRKSVKERDEQAARSKLSKFAEKARLCAKHSLVKLRKCFFKQLDKIPTDAQNLAQIQG